MAKRVRLGSTTEVLKTLKDILRVARKRSSAENIKDCLWSQEIIATYRERQNEQDRLKIRAYRSQAKDYKLLLEGVKEQIHLWQLDAGIEKRFTGAEIAKLAARRVGLTIPDSLYEDQDQEKEKDKAEKKAHAQAYLAAKKK